MGRTLMAQPHRPSGWSVLWGLARQYRGRMILLGVASFLGAMLEAGFLVLLTSTVLTLASGNTTIGPLLGHSIPISVALWIAGAAVAIRLALSYATVKISASLGAYVRSEQRRRVARAYLGTEWAVQQAEAAGRLQELLTSFVGNINAAMLALTQAVTASLSLIAFLSTGVLVNPLATLAVLGALVALGVGLAPLRRRIRRQSGASADTNLQFATTIAEFGMLGQEMQTFGVRDRFEDRLGEVIEVNTEQQRRVQVLGGMLSPTYTFFAYAAVIAAVAIMRVFGVGDLAAVGSIMLLMLRSLTYGQQLLGVSGALAAALPFLERVDETLSYYRSHRAQSGQTVPGQLTPLEFAQVSFSYSKDRPALNDVSFTLRKGEMLGVIGPSGSGKSTLAQLLLGLRPPSEGAITINEVDLHEVDRAWWTRRVAFVPQDPLLFTGTVAENIRFFREGVDNQALLRAAEQANVLADIDSLPQGFDTHLGERGSQLSGGQRQRLSIARALVGRPELLVLDEPTSALDGHSEALIRQTLAGLQGNVTLVIIAHRMSTLDLCDRILVIEQGHVTGLDAPEVLRGTNAFYQAALTAARMA